NPLDFSERFLSSTSDFPFPRLILARRKVRLQRLPIRYRKPYTARHSSVSWDLMIGRNPLWVAKQHGHSLLTMLRVYAARTADAAETDAAAIREAMGYIDRVPAPPADGGLRAHLAVDLPVAGRRVEPSTGTDKENDGGEGGIRTEGTRMINKLLKSQEFQYPQIPSSPRIWHLIWH
ncbi:MAG: hypothetical protein WBV35_08890, partial [Steroidobacteraceae bacterium]